MDREQSSLSANYFMLQLLSSSLTNICGLVIGHPFETLKVRFQSQSQPLPQLIKNLYVQESPWFLFKGFLVPLITYIPYYTATFSVTKFLPHMLELQNPYKEFYYGAIAGSFSIAVFHPFELLKTIGQLSPNKVQYAQEINQLGLKGLYKGFLITFLREVPGWSMFFGVYDLLKGDEGGMVAGGTAGFMAWLVGLPQDVLKTRIMNDNSQITIRQASQEVYTNHGIKGFFKGGQLLLLRGTLINSIVLPLFDFFNAKLCH